MSYTKRKDGRLMKKVTFEGKAHYVYGRTPSEIKDKIDKLNRKYYTGSLDPSNISMSEWAYKWLETYKKSNEKKTQRFYRDIIKLHIVPYLGIMRLKNITQLDIINLLNDMESRGITKTRIYTLQTINQILNKAVENDLISKNVAMGIKLPSHKSKEKQVIPKEIIDKISNTDDCFMFEFLIYTGLRRGEMVALTPDDIDFKHKLIRVNKAAHFEHNQAEIKGTKTNENRFVPILDVIYNKLYSHVNKTSNFVFSSRTGGMLSEQSLKRKLEKANSQIGYKFTYHECRHTFVTLMYESGIDIKQAQKWSGHKDINVLLNVYTHLDEKNNQDAIDKMNRKLSEKLSAKM